MNQRLAKTEVRIAEFKSRLSAYLRSVRKGQEIIVKDRDTPIARVLPYRVPRQRLVTIPPRRSLREFERLLAASSRPRKLKWSDVEEALRWTRRDKLEP